MASPALREALEGMTALDLAAFAIAGQVCDGWAAAARETGGPWPNGCCVETATSLADELDDRLPACLPAEIFGFFVFDIPVPVGPLPAHLLGIDGKVAATHAWVELGSGMVLDPTAGQFYKGGPALRAETVRDRNRWRYHAVERTTAAGEVAA